MRRLRSYAELEATRGRHTCLWTPRPNFARVGLAVGLLIPTMSPGHSAIMSLAVPR